MYIGFCADPTWALLQPLVVQYLSLADHQSGHLSDEDFLG